MGGNRGNKERFTSFVKARLNCSIPGEYPFYFDEIQASTSVISSSLNQDLLYAVFTTPTNSIGGSAVCAFRMADVEAVFEAGPFKAQADSNSNWLPVPEGNVPQPKPGTCVNNSKRLPDENVNFLKDNSLMDSAVEAIWSQPIIMMASINFRFTQIVVDPQVETLQAFGAQSMRTDVIFVSTDDGRVFKLINTHHLIAKQNNQLMAQSNQPFYMPAPAASATGQARLRAGQFLDPAPSSAFPSNQKPPTAASLIGQTYQAQAVREPLPDISAQTIVIEELHLFDSRTPILGLQIHHSPKDYSKLIILSGKQLKAVPLSRCERALSCLDCVALYDPYCAWNFHQQLCQNVGRSANSAAGLFAHNQRAPNQPANGWFSANNLNQANNHTIAWWQQCPAQSVAASEQANQQVGLPFRSLFSSHLQVPSRFDYASNHHLSHTALVSLVTPNLVSNHQASPVIRQPQPVSECLTYCGGLYTPHQQQNQQQQSQHQQLASAGYGQLGGQEQSQSSQLMMNCADFVQQHYIGNLQSSGFPPNFNANNNNLYYTSENLYLAVIICAVSGIILGLAFGFALGRNSRKHDSSICSSTFDETNLYMASTGSHHGAVASNLFAPQQVPLNRPHLPIQASSSHLYSNGLAGLIAPNGTQNNAAAGGLNTNSRSNGLLLQQQQLRL